MPEATLATEYIKMGVLGLVALTALIGLIVVFRLYIKRTDQYVADLKGEHAKYTTDLKETEKSNRAEMKTLLEEFIASAKAEREDYRKVIEKTTSTLEAFLSRYDRRSR